VWEYRIVCGQTVRDKNWIYSQIIDQWEILSPSQNNTTHNTIIYAPIIMSRYIWMTLKNVNVIHTVVSKIKMVAVFSKNSRITILRAYISFQSFDCGSTNRVSKRRTTVKQTREIWLRFNSLVINFTLTLKEGLNFKMKYIW
jgi:hypothetical protein